MDNEWWREYGKDEEGDYDAALLYTVDITFLYVEQRQHPDDTSGCCS
ncbi:hypothetical protein [Paenibacillus sp. SYP-B4298]|nr:hypothetical protein [Paenibacillus sp. SYP-B4298]